MFDIQQGTTVITTVVAQIMYIKISTTGSMVLGTKDRVVT